jgi:hypothetical protein
MKRRIVMVAAAVLALCVAVTGLHLSGASFTDASQSTITVSAVTVSSLVHLYSHQSDPDGWGGYYQQPNTTTHAATGLDGSLTVDLGRQRLNTERIDGIFTAAAASTLPSGVSSITINVTILADSSGVQPFRSFGFGNLGSGNRTNPITLAPGQRVQFNVSMNLPRPSGAVYNLTAVLTITYPGYTGSYYKYTVPIKLTAD